MELAALATVAVPGLDVVDVLHPRTTTPGIDEAIAVDGAGKRWVVRAPESSPLALSLDNEITVLAHLRTYGDALPFAVPQPAGSAALSDGGRAYVHPHIDGLALDPRVITAGPGLAAQLGRALAAIHELPQAVVEASGLPVYNAEEYRRRRLAEVDAAAQTGRVPVVLLQRWEQRLEDVALWRFTPVVTHNDLSPEQFVTQDGAVTAVLGWGEVAVADPADDLAWLLALLDEAAMESVLEAYWVARTELRDPHISDRAKLAAELALVRWLLHGQAVESDEITEDAVSMLEQLAAVIEEEKAAAEQAREEAERVRVAEREAERQRQAEHERETELARAAEAAEQERARETAAAAAVEVEVTEVDDDAVASAEVIGDDHAPYQRSEPDAVTELIDPGQAAASPDSDHREWQRPE